MSDIQVGDVVMVVRWPHEHSDAHCYSGVVSTVVLLQAYTFCQKCKTRWEEPSAHLSGSGCIPLSWLRRIPPLTEPVTETLEETT